MQPPIDKEACFSSAKSKFNDGEYRGAIPHLVRLLRDDSYHVRALSNIGACLFQMGHYHAAKKYLERALSADPCHHQARLNLANTLYALGDYAAADSAFREAIQNENDNEAAWQGRFECCFALALIDECRRILRDWPPSLQDRQKYYLANALLLRREGKDTEALRVLQRAARSTHAPAEVYAWMAEILLASHRLQDGLAMAEKAISIQPDNIFYLCMKANIFYILSDVEKCSESFAAAARVCPQSAALLLNQHLLFPVIPASSQQIDACRLRFLDGLAIAESTPDLELIYQHPIALHTFTLAYHNRNDRVLLERYSSLMQRLANPLLSELEKSYGRRDQSCSASTTKSDKIRIGFLSRYFYGHSNTMAFQGLIRLIDRRQFEVVLIHVFGGRDDNVRAELNSFADQVINLPNDLNSIYMQLHSLEITILYFTDLGMTPYDFLFPLFRASPIQITGWGIPHTSGNSCVDYYISSEDIEPAGADDLYTEKLIRLPGGLPCCFYAESLEIPEFGREYFFLPYHCKLVGCLQSLHKLHPDFDHLLEGIAVQNPEVIFVFVEDAYERSTELFLNRLTLSAPSAKEQIIVLKTMGRGEYQALSKCMDLLLDPIYYGSGITFFEAVLAGTPVITLEGEYLRSRVVASGYREMGIYNAPIASTSLEYVQIVHDLLEDDSKRESLRKQILYQRHRVVNRSDYVRHFEDFCLEVTCRMS